MDCPQCRIPLTMSDRQGVEIDYCPQCRGVWLDRGELDKIIERQAAFTQSPPPPPPPVPTPTAAIGTTMTTMTTAALMAATPVNTASGRGPGCHSSSIPTPQPVYDEELGLAGMKPRREPVVHTWPIDSNRP